MVYYAYVRKRTKRLCIAPSYQIAVMHSGQLAVQLRVWPPAQFDAIAVATSAGGLRALTQLLRALPAEFPTPIVVVHHLSPHYASRMAEILDSRTALRVCWADHQMPLMPGTVYLAPPDRHVLVAAISTLALSDGPKLHWTRPAADALFRSVAAVGKDRAIGVILTGYGRDGAAGAQALKQAGARVIAQDPATCEASPMPAAAIETGSIDFVLPLERIAPALISLCMVPGAADLFRVASAAGAHLPYRP